MSEGNQLTVDELIAQEIAEVTLDDYGFTGECFARLADGWVSVRGALPQERVTIQVQPPARRTRRLFATLLEVLTPSSVRVDPGCPWDSVCRGCQLRHMTLGEEQALKKRGIAEVLAKFAGVKGVHVEWIAPGKERGGARIRSALTWRPESPSQGELGLIAPGQESLIPMNQCPAMHPATQELIADVMRAFDRLAEVSLLPGEQEKLTHVRLASAPVGKGGYVMFDCAGLELESAQDYEEPKWLARVRAGLPDEVGVWVKSGGRVLIHLQGPDTMVFSQASQRLPHVEVNPHVWVHATYAPAMALYQALWDWFDAGPGGLLDVGCATGGVSLSLSSRMDRCVGFDANLDAVRLAQRNAQQMGVQEHVEFFAAAWQKGMLRLVSGGERFRYAAINPMREPVGERALGMLSALGVEQVVYLGPSPAAAAKDIAHLLSQGWELVRVAGADLHPQTYHVMLVAKLERRK